MPPRKSYGLVSSQASLPENGPLCSSRVSSTTSRHPLIVLPPSDSRQSVNRPIPAAPKLTNKRTRIVSVLETEASNQESQSRKKTPQNQQKKKNNEKKSKKKKSNPPNNSNSGLIIDWRQDSEAENDDIRDGQKEADKK